MKPKFFLLAALFAGLALVATALTADDADRAAELTETVASGIVSDFPLPRVWICHHPPGKNGRGADQAETGKVVVSEVFVGDYVDLCGDLDDDRSSAGSSDALLGDAPEAAVFVERAFTPTCDAQVEAYDAEIYGHLDNHDGDCWLGSEPSVEDCAAYTPQLDGSCSD